MRKLFTILACAAAMVACENDEIVRQDLGDKIEFGNAFVDNATRATDNTYGANKHFTEFAVYGTVEGNEGKANIYNGAAVSGTWGVDAEGKPNVWTCASVKQYWIEDAKYNFAGVVDADAVSAPINTETGKYGMPETITYNTDGQKDLLYATATATGKKTGENGPVNLTFSHLLSKAWFTVTSNTENGYYYNVTGIKISNFETGTYTIAYDANGNDISSWAGTTGTDIEFGDIENVTKANGSMTNATQMLLIPNADDFTVSCVVDLYKDGTKLSTETVSKTISTDLEKGCAYNFTLSLSVGEEITFSVTTNPEWTTKPDTSLNM